jgi:hypothetical protein
MTCILYICYLNTFNNNILIFAILPINKNIIRLEVCSNVSIALLTTIGFFTRMDKVSCM